MTVIEQGYCLRCGSQHFALQEDRKRWLCADCGFTFFQNPAAAVAALILNEKNEVLVARRAQKPHQGAYDLPGGFIDHGENAPEALCRELHEELGIQVAPDHLTLIATALNDRYEYGSIAYSTVDIGFRLQVDSTLDLQANDDVASLHWVPLQDVFALTFAFSSMLPLLRQLAVHEGALGEDGGS